MSRRPFLFGARGELTHMNFWGWIVDAPAFLRIFHRDILEDISERPDRTLFAKCDGRRNTQVIFICKAYAMNKFQVVEGLFAGRCFVFFLWYPFPLSLPVFNIFYYL